MPDSGSLPERRHSTGGVGLPPQERRATMRRSTAEVSYASTQVALNQQAREDIRRLHQAIQQAQAASQYLREHERERVAGRETGLGRNAPIVRLGPLAEEPLFVPLQSSDGRTGHTGPPVVQEQQVIRGRPRQREGGNAAWAHANEGRVRHAVKRTLAFFGYGTGNRHRRELVSLVWTICFGFVQVRQFRLY